LSTDGLIKSSYTVIQVVERPADISQIRLLIGLTINDSLTYFVVPRNLIQETDGDLLHPDNSRFQDPITLYVNLGETKVELVWITTDPGDAIPSVLDSDLTKSKFAKLGRVTTSDPTALTATTISPAETSMDGGATLTISGTNFSDGVTVSFGG